MSIATEYALAAFFIVYGVVVFGLAGLPSVRRAGIAVVIANLAFTVAAVAVVLADVWPLTTTGVVLTLASGVYTAGFRRAAVPGRASDAGVTLLLARGSYSLRSRSRLMEWSASLRSTSVARGRVGRMFSIRLGRLMECQISRAAKTACSSVSVA